MNNTSTTTWQRHVSGCLVGGLALLLASTGNGLAHEAKATKLDFVPPAAGTYRLERIMLAPDGNVIDARHQSKRLLTYTRGKVTLLSLMYTGCSDETGCPLAFYSIAMIKRDLEKSAGARGRVQVISLSFDPERDTPEVMRAYGGPHANGKSSVPWHFLTTASRDDLTPLLDGFGQDVSRPRAASDDKSLLHVLKLFLIDGQGWVREIYTTSYLAPQVVVNDIKTLLLEEGVKVD
ncbi:MAG TPA: SCO family protein [Burkholderiales bacterium]|nr:SCO family protein [Burkholderiales bacterium]